MLFARIRRPIVTAVLAFAITSGCASGTNGDLPAAPASSDPPAPDSQPTRSVTTTGPDTIATSSTAPVTETSEPGATTSLAGSPSSPATTAGIEDATWFLPSGKASELLELMAAIESLRSREFLARPPVETISANEPGSSSAPLWGGNSPVYLGRQLKLLELLQMSSGGADMNTISNILNVPASEPFYDFERGTILLPSGAEPLDEYQKWVLVGELVHALTAQHDPEVIEGLRMSGGNHDESAARSALLEGEAALVQSLYLDSLSPERRSEVVRLAAERPPFPLDTFPPALRELLLFPYREGSLLVVDLFRLGGFEALNQALDHPPASTEQVLHADSYRRLEQGSVIEPFNVSPEGYMLMEYGTWGESRWRILFNHYSGPADAFRAAEGWGGDHFQIHQHSFTGDLVFVVRYVGDTFADEAEMNSAIRTMLSSGIGKPSEVIETVTEWVGGTAYALLAWDVDAITVVIASDTAAGRMVAAQLGIPG